MIECSKRDTCRNRDLLCDKCHALANVYDHHPCYGCLVSYMDFMDRLEEIALSHDLRLIMQRAPVGCGFTFYFKDEKTHKYSATSITWHYQKEDIDSMLHHLYVLARDFKKEIEKR